MDYTGGSKKSFAMPESLKLKNGQCKKEEFNRLEGRKISKSPEGN